MGHFGYLTISKNRENKRNPSVFILIQHTLGKESFFTREILSWENGEILHLSTLFLLGLF